MKQRTFIKDLRNSVEETVTVKGWINTYRDQGKMVFFDIRDMSGLIQAVVLPGNEELIKIAKSIRDEFVVEITAVVNKRPEKMIKEGIENGDIELEVKEISILAESLPPVFPISGDTRNIDEDTRLRYRYLDMRSERVKQNLKLRSEVANSFRKYMLEKMFTEVETPTLSAPTKEGSRDFVVPSRHHKGKFYALPQSPQQYKQLLMSGGIERYFQIAKAYRDEDLRADRAFEHTQIDIEMSFMSRDEFMDFAEEMVISVMRGLGREIKQIPFPRITYKEAMEKYGDDKFDLRTPEEKERGVLAFAWVVDFPMYEKTEDSDDETAKGEWTFSHNPFSSPQKEYLKDHIDGKNLGGILAEQYDLVCNGFEVGGGSVRAHLPEVLEATYRNMGYDEKETEEAVGHMIEAFKYGTPPHAGMAMGLDRLIMILAGEDSIKEVQAFPQTRSGKTAIMNAPIEIGNDMLKDLGIKVDAQDKE